MGFSFSLLKQIPKIRRSKITGKNFGRVIKLSYIDSDLYQLSIYLALLLLRYVVRLILDLGKIWVARHEWSAIIWSSIAIAIAIWSKDSTVEIAKTRSFWRSLSHQHSYRFFKNFKKTCKLQSFIENFSGNIELAFVQ